MVEDLINKCYENKYGIDFKKFHKKISLGLGKKQRQLIDKLNKEKNFIFNDGVSNNFTLIIQDNLVYLIGEKSCYPCRPPVFSAYGDRYNFVECFIIPHENRIIGETDIRKSSIVINCFHELIPFVKDESNLIKLITDYRFIFSNCKWFKAVDSLYLFIRLATFWDYKEKVKQMYSNGLMNPFEFTLYNIYKGYMFKNNHFVKYFVLSLSESTNMIFNNEEIEEFLNTLSNQQLEEIFCVDKIKKSIYVEKLNEEYIADLLEIDGHKRYPEFVDDEFWVYYMRNRGKSLFKEKDLNKKYLKEIKTNFRLIENELRKDKGFEEVGSYYMEKLLYKILKETFPMLTFLKQYSPKWLSPQRFDIYIKEIDLAVEYNGAQHFLEIDFFGGAEGLKNRQILDKNKKEKCKENSIELFEIRYDESFENALSLLKSIIVSRLP